MIGEIVQGLKAELVSMVHPSNQSAFANYVGDTPNDLTRDYYQPTMGDVSTAHSEISQLHDEIQSLRSTISQMQEMTKHQMPPPTFVQYPGAYHTPSPPPDRSHATTPTGGSRNDSTSTLAEPKDKPTFTAKYCWTHGACGYEGKSCHRKAQGHKDEASFNDRMGGSTKGIKRFNRKNK